MKKPCKKRNVKQTKMAQLMKRLISLDKDKLGILLQSYMDETLYTACILGKKHEEGKPLSAKDKGKIEFIEHLVLRVEEKIREKNQATTQSPDDLRGVKS